MNLIFQGALASMPPTLKLDKMPLSLIRPLCLIDESDLVAYAAMREYKKQIHTCPFEHISSRAKVKGILSELRQLNPEVNDSFYAALTNIKKEYLP